MTPLGRVAKDEKHCRLNRPANGYLAHPAKPIKTGYDALIPGVGQVDLDSPAQIPEPMALTCPA